MTIAVAVSGGADSLLSLKLLQEQGQDPIALHACFQNPDPEMRRVSSELQMICAQLKIDFYELDLRKEFQESVIAPFVDNYARGVTPNPCAICNKRIKFGALLKSALNLGAEKLATGHYAKIFPGNEGKCLFRGADKTKEQSYFLSLLSPSQLEYACFPLANWCKQDIYHALSERSLAPVNRKESLEICFVPDNDYRRFIRDKAKKLPPPGPIKDTLGNILGRHQGLYRYTIGQRRGLGISYSEPLYVLGKDLEQNILLVGTKQDCKSLGCRVRDYNLLKCLKKWPETVFVQTRYRQDPVPAWVRARKQTLEVNFQKTRKPATPGQIAAFYSQSEELLGAGIIHE